MLVTFFKPRSFNILKQTRKNIQEGIHENLNAPKSQTQCPERGFQPMDFCKYDHMNRLTKINSTYRIHIIWGLSNTQDEICQSIHTWLFTYPVVLQTKNNYTNEHIFVVLY